jgi:hypothetical protein
MFDFIRRNLSLFVTLGVTVAVAFALAGGDVSEVFARARR